MTRQINKKNIQRVSCLNFWDEACWFLSLRVFGPLSSSLMLFSQRFSRYVLRPSSGVCRTREPSRNFELCPLLNRSSVKVPELDIHLKKAGGHIGWNIVEITIQTKTIVRKPLIIKIQRVILISFYWYFHWCNH